MSELADLYQRVVIEHNRSPRHYNKLDPCTHHATGYNPLCGDEVELYLRMDGNRVREAGFQGESCAIATASASMLTEAVRGLDAEAIRELARAVSRLIRDGDPGADEWPADLDVLGVVSRFPGRSKCAELPWKALTTALDAGSGDTVSTEE